MSHLNQIYFPARYCGFNYIQEIKLFLCALDMPGVEVLSFFYPALNTLELDKIMAF